MTYTDSNRSQIYEAANPKPQSLSTLTKAGLILGFSLLMAVSAWIIFTLLQETTPTDRIRDILLIALSIEFFIIGVAAVLLIFQIARLVNLFQNEIKPVLEAANETMNTVRGTAVFLSDSVVQPAIKLNSYFSAFRRVLDILNIKQK